VDRRSVPPRAYRSTHRRPRRRALGSSSGPRPDLVAAWAVALGIFLILVASATSKGATGGASPGSSGGAGLAAPARTDHDTRVSRMHLQVATWYGPGLYGRRTACGVRLRRSTQGVAHRRLPCGTPVTFYYRGRFKTVPVIDRGPYAHGISWDLTRATADSLRLGRTSPVRTSR
jgi:hypothetical protein